MVNANFMENRANIGKEEIKGGWQLIAINHPTHVILYGKEHRDTSSAILEG
jgi:hypothetical protein